MQLTTAQRDRAAGVLLGQACGDALGVPYEFGRLPLDTEPEMKGGGLGPYAPSEWSDDTQMAICIARIAATGADLTDDIALNQIAKAFVDWRHDGASDIGNQTATVLTDAEGYAHFGARISDRNLHEPDFPWAMCLRKEAGDYTAKHPMSAGNGALAKRNRRVNSVGRPRAHGEVGRVGRAADPRRSVGRRLVRAPCRGDSRGGR